MSGSLLSLSCRDDGSPTHPGATKKCNKKTSIVNTEPPLEYVEMPEAKVPSYWLTRFLILRLLGVLYAIGFLIAVNQIVPLIGTDGLLPMEIYLERVTKWLGSESAGFMRLPSLFWFWHTDTALLVIAWTGLLLSLLVVAGYANAILLFLLWAFYLSFVHVGQEWYGYGWEIQLTETGFLAIFLCPLLDARSFPKYAPQLPIIFLFRWLTFRVMFGAGLIKFRGDEIWRNGTALYYHFETQPLPGPLSRWFHFLPHGMLKVGVWFNHLAELVAPLFVFWPRVARHAAGMVIVLFQLTIFLSGNLSFLNWLTILPALSCFDDGFWARILPAKWTRKAERAAENAVPSASGMRTAWFVTAVIGILSLRPIVNMLSPGQIMNTSFDALNLVNTYGAFGTVGKERWNVVFEGTTDSDSSDKATWKAYPYKGLPVDVRERPPQIAPYQLRLDWQMWFAAMSTPDEYTWTYHLVWKLLHQDAKTIGLFGGNPFPAIPPRYIRAVLYRYSFAPRGSPGRPWWIRERIGIWIPALSADDLVLRDYLRGRGWIR
jgi:hypothetical protein